MIPVVQFFKKHPRDFDAKICITSQHKSMLQQVLRLFEIEADYDLNIMKGNQTLSYLTSQSAKKIDGLLREEKFDLIFSQGDTTTAMMAPLVAFYHKIKSAHVEAGLRSRRKYSPFPEEINRVLISHIADYHFAPTSSARENLLTEGIESGRIWVTGNTVIDALFFILEKVRRDDAKYAEYFSQRKIRVDGKKMILVTGHRRENFGKSFENICAALKSIAETYEVDIVYPVHLNPNVKNIVFKKLGRIKNIHLIAPLPYDKLVYLMDKAYLVVTDSGGIQEEAPSLGKPVLVMREVTERPEGIEAGTVKLSGTERESIISDTRSLLEDDALYERMSRASNPYGDGKASQRIFKVIESLKDELPG